MGNLETILYWLIAIAIVIMLIGEDVELIVMSISEEDFCKKKGYVGYVPFQDLEPGYVKCYQKEYLNHEARVYHTILRKPT